ncbi:hypothetical protein BDQ94DRAFT_112946 [Aspergillus welwitschiae]|uniref:Secreted peptide n=1 Tax=Aspergillus welwitschiae TaxID=1341132 RepID=A0A3F3PKY9_9EURO|nr:hypothetical protein BDQ94DRAFT_112946 [Aspergillus welwitschiae]RDH27518.1 hypothetical protein BDQ94DRAFT_112946 [Aspergillus welwitschiae]
MSVLLVHICVSTVLSAHDSALSMFSSYRFIRSALWLMIQRFYNLEVLILPAISCLPLCTQFFVFASCLFLNIGRRFGGCHCLLYCLLN